MPFDLSPDIHSTPDIRIFFHGLLMLVPREDDLGKRCDVYVINHHDHDDHSSQHELSVEVSIDQPQPSYPFLRLGSRILDSGLEISTEAPEGVTAYNGSIGPDAYPLSEAIDFGELHPGSQLNPSGAHRGVITIRDGILYTAARREADARLVNEQLPCKDRAPVGLIIGASISLNDRELILKWGEGDLDSLSLSAKDDDGKPVKYIISISNSRSIPKKKDQSDFKHLYQVLDVDKADQLELQFKNCDDKTQTTPKIPCIPGIGGG